jgi:hypothetical protein
MNLIIDGILAYHCDSQISKVEVWNHFLKYVSVFVVCVAFFYNVLSGDWSSTTITEYGSGIFWDLMKQ